jgi:hypothetical protein
MPLSSLLPLVLLAAQGAVLDQPPTAPDPAARYLFYLHGRILEVQGREAISPEFGAYEYDAILKAFADRGFVVISELRGPETGIGYGKRVALQVRGLIKAGVAADHITVAGFSKGGALAQSAAAELAEPSVNYVVMAGCFHPVPAFTARMKGRMLSIYDAKDTLAGSCAEAFARASGVKSKEIVLTLGRGHGTFFAPLKDWLDPACDWATGH